MQARLRSLEQLMPFATEGELRAQIDAGAWNVLEPDAALVMEQPDGLWDRLVRYCERLRNTI